MPDEILADEHEYLERELQRLEALEVYNEQPQYIHSARCPEDCCS